MLPVSHVVGPYVSDRSVTCQAEIPMNRPKAMQAVVSKEIISKPRVRDRIMQTARDLFYSRGIRAVGVDSIACGAGTNKMSFYRCFGSKDALVAEYLRGQEREAWRLGRDDRRARRQRARAGRVAVRCAGQQDLQARLARLRARERGGRDFRARPPGAGGRRGLQVRDAPALPRARAADGPATPRRSATR